MRRLPNTRPRAQLAQDTQQFGPTNRWLAQIVGYEYVQALIGILGQNNVWLYAARTVREVDTALGAVVEHGLRRVAEADPWLDLAEMKSGNFILPPLTAVHFV